MLIKLRVFSFSLCISLYLINSFKVNQVSSDFLHFGYPTTTIRASQRTDCIFSFYSCLVIKLFSTKEQFKNDFYLFFSGFKVTFQLRMSVWGEIHFSWIPLQAFKDFTICGGLKDIDLRFVWSKNWRYWWIKSGILFFYIEASGLF